MSKRAQACFAGRGALLIQCAEEWRAQGGVVSAVLSDDPASQSWARQLDIPVNATSPTEADHLVLVGEPIENANAYSVTPRRLTIAFQDSLLPAYAGWYATTWALLRREKTHGVTWYTKRDGHIHVLQRALFPIAPEETAHSLNAKCFDAGVSTFRALVPLLEQTPVPVLPEATCEASYFSPERRPPAAGILDFTQDTEDVLATVRALTFGDRPNPLAMPKVWTGARAFCIGAAVPVATAKKAAPGDVLECTEQSITVAAKDGAVLLTQITTLSGEAASVLPALTRIPLLSPQQTHRLTTDHEALSACESFWTRRLESVLPFTWPFPVHPNANAPEWESEEVVTRGSGGDAEERAAMVASFFARISGVDSVDLGWHSNDAVSGDPRAALIENVVPVLAQAGPDTTLRTFSDTFTRHVRAAKAQHTYPRDLLARQPTLRAMGAARFSVCLSEFSPSLDPDTDLLIVAGRSGGSWVWRYDKNRIAPARVAQLISMFVDWVQTVQGAPDQPLRRLAIRGERGPLEGNVSAYPQERDLGGWVDVAAQKTPDAPALIYESRMLRYRDLSAQSNRMAALLQARGVGPDARVALLMERSPEALIALLGVIKAGGCYVPIDPHFPPDRIAYIMERSSAALVIVQPELRHSVPAGREVVVLDDSLALLRAVSDAPVKCAAMPENLLYVIYTSGSTGRPKGVAMTRRAGMNLVAWQNASSTPEPRGHTFQYASLSFDVSFQEIFSTWAAGGALVVVPEALRRDPMQLLRLARERAIVRWFMPYAALQQLAVSAAAAELYPDALRDLITAGEALRITPEIRAFFERMKACRLHNQYGPSETHVATAFLLTGSPQKWRELPPIGLPIANASALLLDASGMPVPAGFNGELFLGGDCLARGYLDQPALTQERFVERSVDGQPHRYYRTGDVARVNAEGQLEFLGRSDDQVKIRGYRVELAEVESALIQHPAVRECAVVAQEQAGTRHLVGYVVADGGGVDRKALRNYLDALLPEYMIPSAFVFIDHIPLTPSGKIHRRALSAVHPMQEGARNDGTPPQNEIERILEQLWRQVLALGKVGIHANFFDLGGDSLKLARVQAGLRSSLKREVSILDLFRFPTIAGLALFLSGGEEAPGPVQSSQRINRSEPIAIVGMAGRFPGAASVSELWRNLCAGRESITFFSDEEVAGAPPAGSELKFVKARGVLDRCEWFDAGLFGYGPREAELMDPQHRVFIESAWEALENAGCDPARYPGAIGVFAACSMNTYLLYNALKDRASVEEFARAFQVAGYQTLMGNDKDYLATRVAYKLNLRGPSMSVQTACSSSLVAICQACESLMSGLSDVALAGGVSISFPQQRGYLYVDGSIASADGHCRPFDASATGTVFGAGAAVVVLKRLSDAQADGDTIYGLIKGWALNNDGTRKAGYMAPSAEGQADVIRLALGRAGVDARTIGFIETHGTGTPIGDPIEVGGLTRAFRQETADSGFCALGSVKANIGHLEAAAGVTGLIKATLSLHHRQLLPLAHFEKPNPLLNLPTTPFYCPRELTDWPGSDTPRRAGVSSFGVGGTNAHVILEEAPVAPADVRSRSHYLLPLSARTDAALDAAASNLANFLEQQPDIALGNVAYTLDVGRPRLAKRAVVVAQDAQEAVAALRSRALLKRGEPLSGTPSVIFLFPGQGSQHIEMGRGLYESEATFREHFDRCAEILRPLLHLDIKTFLFPPEKDRETLDKQLTQTQYAQPCIFAIEYALAQWWISLGVNPAALVGHSAGEYTAACLLGVFTLEDALALLVRRAQLMNELPAGRMLAVRMTEDEVNAILPPELSISGCNAPSLTVVSGPSETIADFAALLEKKGVGAKALQTSHAFHSAMMDPALEPFRKAVAATPRQPARERFLSTHAGGWISGEDVADAEYWVRQIRDGVRFSAALREAMKLPNAVFMEVGPSQALTTLALQHDEPATPVVAIPAMRHAKEAVADTAAVLRAVGRLWCAGVNVNMQALYGERPPRRIALPTYPFERKRFWIEPPTATTPVRESASTLEAAPESAAPTAALPPEEAQGAQSADGVLSDVLDILQDLSGIERAKIEPECPFLEMGFDSLFLTQVSLAFQRRFLVKLTLRQMLDDLSSPAAIARYLAEQLPARKAPGAPAFPESPNSPSPAITPRDATLSIATSGPFVPEGAPAEKETPSVPTRHGPFAPINKSAGDTLTPKQQQALSELIARYTKKTQRSKEYTRQHRPHFADPRAVAGFRVTWKEMTYPVVSARSDGSKIWDLDGNEFLDVTMGFGTNLFGHSPAFVRKALEQQLSLGIEIGPQSAVAGEVAQAIALMTGMERVTFCNTGSEAVMGAVRAARTVTGRDRIVYFSGDYHGVNDEVLGKGQLLPGGMRSIPIAPGIPRDMVSQALILPYGDPAALETIRAQAATLAAVLVEPVQSRKPQLQPREFLHALRDLTREMGIALILDEVITGFRIHPGGAQAWFGVHADLATYGKVIGGGMPIGVIAGRREYMDAFDGGVWNYGDNSVPEAGVTFFAGTFVRHPLAMTAARAVMKHLQAAGPALQHDLNERTARFAQAVNNFFTAEGVDLRINNFGSLWYFSHGEAFHFFSLLFHYLRDAGIHIWEGRPCFLSSAHSDADIARLIEAFKQAIFAMREGGFISEPTVAIGETGPFALIPAQHEIWLASKLDPASAPAFNESCAFTFRGLFNQEAMETALERLVARHEALRTTFDPAGEFQVVHPVGAMDVKSMDLSSLEADEREKRLAAIIHEEVSHSFDLAALPLARARCVRMDADRLVMILTVHHIVCDGWSYDVMARDLSELYSLACRHEPDARPLPTQFRAYAAYVDGYRRDDRADVDMSYWVKALESPPSAIEWPIDRPRPAQRTFNGAMEVAVLDGPLVASVKELGTRHRATLFATLLAHYAVLLQRLTGQTDLIVGIPAAGQQLLDNGELVGHCANLLPVRLSVDPDKPFREVLAAAQRALLDAYEHQGLTFGDLIKALQLPRDPARSPLIQTTFNVDPAIYGLQFDGLETDIVINPRTAYQFEVSLNIVAHADRVRIECNYNTDLFEQATIARWIGHLAHIMRTVTVDPDVSISAIPLMTAEEERTILFDWNRTQSDYPATCIHTLFEEQAAAAPDRIALSMAGRTMTYAELNAQANRLARALRQCGVRPDTAVGICVDRSMEEVIGLLGILKAGGAYLPLDPKHPDERISLQLSDASTTCVLVQSAHAARFTNKPVTTIVLDHEQADWRALSGESLTALERGEPQRPDQLAYILYTSGSTGQPKGVMVEHKSVVRLVKEMSYAVLDEEQRMLRFAPLAFDASTFELWGALLNGARLVIMPPGTFSIGALAQTLQNEQVTVAWLTAGLFHTIMDENPDCLRPLKQLLTGGEVTSTKRILRLLQLRPDITVIHGYGPTESTTFATTEVFTETAPPRTEPPPIGRPIENTQVYVLDAHLQPTPIGVIGELFIGGDGLARGYLNRAELTAAAFIKNPLNGTPGERLYRTGDLVRWRADGRLDFIGRRDGQVKLRGFRIELGEIESVLATLPGIQASAVVVRVVASGDKQLVAYVVPNAPSPKPDIASLQRALASHVPDFMVPSLFLVRDSLPLNANGKVDRNALVSLASEAREPTRPVAIGDRASLREAVVLDAWKQVLGVSRVSRTDDFFALGGHSLAALKLINRLQEAGYSLEVSDLFRNPTVESLANVIIPTVGESAATVVLGTSSDVIVQLREGAKERPPLCLLPSDYGDLLIYSNLMSHLDPSLPCVGLQCPTMYQDDRGLHSMEELAAWFIRELRAKQPRGPYFLAGYCFGGLVAMEMARQLRAVGEQMGMLALIDARPFRPKTESSEYLRMRIHGALRAKPRDWKRHLGAKFAMWREAKLIDAMVRHTPDKLEKRDLNRWVLETRMLQSYRSTDYPGPITFFYPEESQYELYGDPSCGWLNLADRVYLHKVGGSHVNMMKEPHVALLAARLQATIRQALEGASAL